jgi:hypothetical protein
MFKSIALVLVTFGVLGIYGCSDNSFSGDAGRGSVIPGKKPNKSNANPSDPADYILQTDTGGIIAGKPCTQMLRVPGRANLYFAGSPLTSTLTYSTSRGPVTDSAITEAPVELTPDRPGCLTPGSKIFFNIAGTISHDLGRSVTDADGKLSDIRGHQLGNALGKSNVIAPLNAMMAVFLGDQAPGVAPASLNYTSRLDRDYETLRPVVGQIFYVGDGKTTSGKAQIIIVPEGTTRLFLGIMDAFEWKNNTGELQGGFSSTQN